MLPNFSKFGEALKISAGAVVRISTKLSALASTATWSPPASMESKVMSVFTVTLLGVMDSISTCEADTLASAATVVM